MPSPSTPIPFWHCITSKLSDLDAIPKHLYAVGRSQSQIHPSRFPEMTFELTELRSSGLTCGLSKAHEKMLFSIHGRNRASCTACCGRSAASSWTPGSDIRWHFDALGKSV